ncbi:MAG: glucose-6-phosphate dehydrogenase [Nitrospirae bacterium]|nr:glucose-6-phosphate dehydrogenase [Nitrospirota bacterium]
MTAVDNENGAVFSKFIRTCDIPGPPYMIDPFVMVIFGGSGDLSRRKLLPALFHLYSENELTAGFSILGCGRSRMEDEQFRAMMKDAVRQFGDEPFDEAGWDQFSSHLFFLSGAFEEDETYDRLEKKLAEISLPSQKGDKNVLYYMAIPSQMMPTVVEKLKEHNLCKGAYRRKMIVEKPFGYDRASAVELNTLLTGAFDEHQIYRIDHYLGKETVQNIIFFRFSNSLFEHLWNSQYIDNVQITVAEDIGIEQRGVFYEETGVVRDIVQNHIMQLIALIAMEPPIGFEAEFIREEKDKVFRAIRPMSDGDIDRFMVRGQYAPGRIHGVPAAGYREEKGVAGDSLTPTFFAGKFFIANWRWAGVPFYVRTGKRLARRVTEIWIQFKQPPLRLFGRTCDALEPNALALAIQPEEKIYLRFGVKYPQAIDKIYPVTMTFSYQDTFKSKMHPAYERLLIDCMRGDLTLFARQDGIEATWEALDPLIARWEDIPSSDFPNYRAGSWGPVESDLLLQNDGRCWLTE